MLHETFIAAFILNVRKTSWVAVHPRHINHRPGASQLVAVTPDEALSKMINELAAAGVRIRINIISRPTEFTGRK